MIVLSILFDIISRIGSFMLIFGVCFFAYDFLFSSILKLNQYTIFNKFFVNDIFSICFSLFTVFNCFKISSPYI